VAGFLRAGLAASPPALTVLETVFFLGPGTGCGFSSSADRLIVLTGVGDNFSLLTKTEGAEGLFGCLFKFEANVCRAGVTTVGGDGDL